MGLMPDPNLPYVYVVGGYRVYEERPAVLYPNGLCVLVDLLGVPSYFEQGRWTYNKGRAIAIATAHLEGERASGRLGAAEYERIRSMYMRAQVFLRPGWSRHDLDHGDPAPLLGDARQRVA